MLLMTQIKLSTEEIIKNAAMEVFVEDGFDGARMQKIADRAQVNKAMLHYYFSSKEVLFEKILKEACSEAMPEMEAIIKGSQPFLEKIRAFVGFHIRQQLKNPNLVSFIFREMNKNPERITSQFENLEMMKSGFTMFINKYEEEVNAGKLRSYPPAHLFIMIQALVDYYPLIKPFYSAFMTSMDHPMDEQFEEVLIDQVYALIENALKK